MKKTVISAIIASGFLGACVEIPVVVEPPVRYVAVQSEYIPPAEYVVGAPLYYESQPGVAFYPMFIGTPGSCYCVVPMRFYRNVWLGVDGGVIYRGHFPYVAASRIEHRHLEAWHHDEGAFRGMRPMHGSFQMVDGHARPMPPQGSMHHQAIIESRVKHDPAEARFPVQNHQPPVNEQRPGMQPGHERGDQWRNPAQVVAPIPQRNDERRPDMQAGHDRGDQGRNPAQVVAPTQQPNDDHRPGVRSGRERGDQGQRPAQVVTPAPAPTPPAKAVAPTPPAESKAKHERDGKACSDQDRKDDKCKK